MKLTFFVASLFCSIGLFAQNGIIKGIIRTSDGKPAESVSVTLKGTNKGTIANRHGYYEIRNILPGDYIVTTTYIGLETKETAVKLLTGQTLTVDFELRETENQLREVIISTNRIKTSSQYVAKMPLKNLENPQVYNIISADLMKQQAITSYDDALKNVPGIFRLWESTGRDGDGGSYFSIRGFESQLTMLNGLPGLTNGNLDPANLERIEVIKGPSGTLFGSPVISYGGLVNNVTKKPYDHFGGEVGYTAGSFGLNRFTADINTPLAKDNSVIIRLNTAYQSENSFQDQGFRKSFFLAPTLSYKASDRLSFLIVSEFMQEEKTNPLMIFLGRETPLQFKDLADLNYNRKLSLTSNELSIKSPRYNVQAQMLYKLSDKWTSQTVVSNGQANSNGYYTYLYDNQDGFRDFGLWVTKTNSTTNTTDIQQNFTGDFKIGSFRNRLLFGLDYFDRKTSSNGTGYARIHNVNLQGEVNYRDPDNPGEELPNKTTLTQPSVDALLANTTPYPWEPKDKAYSAYVSDVFNILPQLSAMASLRVDHFKNSEFGQTTLSPKFGINYQPVKDQVALFVNYMNGFSNVAPGAVADEDGDPTGEIKNFRPEHANQFEAGIKTNLIKDKLNATISYYNITVDDVVIADPTNPYNTFQGGKQRNKGFEVDIQTSPVEGLNIIIGYAYNDSKILDGEDMPTSWFEVGKRPLDAGSPHLANFWITYKLLNTKLNGLGIGFGGNYVGEYNTINLSATGNFLIPSYTSLNGSVFYDAGKFRVGFNLNNITNKGYAGGWSTVNPQKTRNIALSLVYKFQQVQ
ncbi:TonB-dependent siderophore receptor [Terrimonas sp.]|uniref:TonB-dependent receptor n=1 Tax=Terrimonas sp. TaxID=1914338 RepID=UPI000D5098F6|nr:TonB-dependent receptor [Terrimonas sp.]PVD51778.1 TonB-dependent siderophore receptor [Terrimonas sp.]